MHTIPVHDTLPSYLLIVRELTPELPYTVDTALVSLLLFLEPRRHCINELSLLVL